MVVQAQLFNYLEIKAFVFNVFLKSIVELPVWYENRVDVVRKFLEKRLQLFVLELRANHLYDVIKFLAGYEAILIFVNWFDHFLNFFKWVTVLKSGSQLIPGERLIYSLDSIHRPKVTSLVNCWLILKLDYLRLNFLKQSLDLYNPVDSFHFKNLQLILGQVYVKYF